jgi:hypothetical protein
MSINIAENFKDFTTLIVQIVVFYVVKPCGNVGYIDNSEEHVESIFGLEIQP